MDKTKQTSGHNLDCITYVPLIRVCRPFSTKLLLNEADEPISICFKNQWLNHSWQNCVATRCVSARNATQLLFQWSLVAEAPLHSTIFPALLKPSLHKNLFNLSPPIPQSSPYLPYSEWTSADRHLTLGVFSIGGMLCTLWRKSILWAGLYACPHVPLIHSMFGYWVCRNLLNSACM